VDAGTSLSNDESVPELTHMPGTIYGGSGDEYGSLASGTRRPPPRRRQGADHARHRDTTVNLYNVLGVRKGIVVGYGRSKDGDDD
jgi:hypothetical protein